MKFQIRNNLKEGNMMIPESKYTKHALPFLIAIIVLSVIVIIKVIQQVINHV